jgi:glycosyltransferase involved in cell wall biosynthesis
MTTIQPQQANNHLDDVLQIISNAAQLYPDSRNLARHQVELLARCGRESEALEACEAFLVRFGVDEDLLSLALQMRHRIGIYDRLAKARTHSISLCMIVKNEEKNLAACLASLKPVVDEMIIVDTGSTDRTIDIATVFGAKVSAFEWNGNFSDARNASLAAARGKWILVMDADEVLAAQDYDAVRQAVREAVGKKLAWSVLTRNYTTRVNAQGWTPNDHVYQAKERADGWHPSWKVRLFCNHPVIRFNGEVHEMVENSLLMAGYTIDKASFVVHHYGGLVESTEEAAEKGRRYFEFGMKKLEKNPRDTVALAELAVQAGEIGSFEEAIVLWNRLLEVLPNNVEALFNKGYSLIKLQRYQEALEISETVLELEPDHKEAAFNFGTASLYIGRPLEAVKKLEPLLKKKPDYPPLLSVMTLLYLLAGQREKAVLTHSKLKVLNYAVTDYAKARAEVLIGLGKEDMASMLLAECAGIGMAV